MKAGIICIGDELLMGRTLNSNMNYIAKNLNALGINLFREMTVKDDKQEIINALDIVKKDVQILFVLGGLGVTDDDMTKGIVASYFNKKLYRNKEALKRVVEYATSKNIPINESMKDFSLIAEDSILIHNYTGVAGGYILNEKDLDVILLPGPPNELIPMLQNDVIPYLSEKLNLALNTITFRSFGLRELDVFLKLKDLIDKYQGKISITTYCGLLDVAIVIRYNANVDSELASYVVSEIFNRFKENIYADTDVTLEEQLVDLLKVRKLKMASVESLSGGNIADSVVSVSGASEVFIEGLVTYSNEAKISRLGVNPKTISTFGAVSKETAYEMVLGLAKFNNVDIAVSTTGIAGPTGATPDKPVGLVYIGIYFNGQVEVHKHIFAGSSRDEVRELVRKTALFYLIKKLK